MPPICWGAADTEGSGSGGALPPERGVGRGAGGGGLRENCKEDGKEIEKPELDLREEKGRLKARFESDQWQRVKTGASGHETENRKRTRQNKWVKMSKKDKNTQLIQHHTHISMTLKQSGSYHWQRRKRYLVLKISGGTGTV